MNKIMLEEQMVLYSFPSDKPERLGHNVYILKDGQRALAIDTGYQQHFQQVIDDLASEGVTIVKVVPSHFHTDSVDGVFLLNKPRIYGNEHAKATLMVNYDEEDVLILAPKKVLTNNAIIEFGGFKLRLISAPGHTDCSVLININDQYLHVGGLYMQTDQGEAVLPYVKKSGVSGHIRSLSVIAKSKYSHYLLAHGPSPTTLALMESGIKERVTYLTALRSSHYKCTLEEALKDVKGPFRLQKWFKEL